MASKEQPGFPSQIAKGFIHDDFLLQTDFGKALYHNYAKDLPIIDYHNHLPPQQISENKQFDNISEVWLKGDHYKWRAMRTLGVNEKYITGSASDQDKFVKWAETVPYTVRNPLFHWTQLELKRYFGIDELLSGKNALDVYDHCNSQLQQSDFRVQGLLQRMQVQVICTTDDPADTLEHHSSFRESGNTLKLLPSFRPDKAFAVHQPEKYRAYLVLLGKAAGKEIKSYTDLLQTLKDRIEFFHSQGCRVSDHGLEKMHRFQLGDFDCETLFSRLYEGGSLKPEEAAYFSFETLVHLGRMYHQMGWVQQFHLGALRNTNQRMLTRLGPDTGFDSIGDFSQASALAGYFDLLDSSDQLAKTVIYNLNPADNEVFASMIGNYNDGSVRAKMQFGSAWWFLDQKDGMEKQINSLSNIGLLSCFIGMLTDSRSFLSFPRHEYFRRILCNLIGQDVENGELPADEKWLGQIVADICYRNARAYFDFF
ncbi:glucuronate isomerase [Poritiphilus flavus]|uniref:Uronate isomerase n=1 Tax=Poritiphilus flavus TaxID=2697053 RepID=A0A6L9EGS3_9FLAO|nr:glucuronate isomerase [Poritiphilus flavus]NAS13822.1 glucuronate isomerase [Poritiphilus flavus]